jgi:hypothetical protein
VTPGDKYRDLERRALAVLRHPADASGFATFVRPEMRLSLWRFPAFEPYQSWSLIMDKGVEGLWVLRRVTWHRAEDYGRAADPIRQAGFMTEKDPAPTLDVIDQRVSATFVSRTMDAIDALETPTGPAKAELGLDGVMNGLASDDRGIELEWWCDGPADWHPFTDGVESVRSRLEATIAG